MLHKAEQKNVEVGDEVWVKPPHARCTTEWRKDHITEINSKTIYLWMPHQNIY